MRQVLLATSGFLAVVFAGSATEANAQTRRPYDDYTPPPSVSPYMNLANNNANSAAGTFMNYQLLVKPQLEQRQTNRQSAASMQNYQSQFNAARLSSDAEAYQKPHAAKHAATRGNYSHYYPTLNRQ